MHMAWGYCWMGLIFAGLSTIFTGGMLTQIILLGLGAAMFWQAILSVRKLGDAHYKPRKGVVLGLLVAAGISFPLRFAILLAAGAPARYADYSTGDSGGAAPLVAGNASTFYPGSVFLMLSLSVLAVAVVGAARFQLNRSWKEAG